VFLFLAHFQGGVHRFPNPDQLKARPACASASAIAFVLGFVLAFG